MKFPENVDINLSYPLRLILLAALGDGDGVCEDSLVAPKLELLETWAACEEIKHAANDGLLSVFKLDA